MNIHLDCHSCGRLLRVNTQFAGRTVRCPQCGTPYIVPSQSESDALRGSRLDPSPASDRYDPVDSGSSDAVFAPPEDAAIPVNVMRPVDPPAAPPPISPPQAPPRPPTADGPPCPACDEPMAGDAVACLVCGFNRVTGKRLRTVSRRLAGRWDSGNFSLLGRLIVFIILVAVCCLPLLGSSQEEPEVQLALLLVPVGGAVFGALLLGTFHRVVVTTDTQGTPILIQQLWVCFVPIPPQTTDLTDFRTIRLTHREGGVNALSLLLLLGLCLLGGVYAIMMGGRVMRRDVYTLEIISQCDRDGAPYLEPVTVHRGRSERVARGIGDDLEQIAGLRYG